MKAVEKDKTTDIVYGDKTCSEAWKILTSMVEDDSSKRAKEQAKNKIEELKYGQCGIDEIIHCPKKFSRRVLNGLPPYPP